MKYISRFAALLMALMMMVGNAGAEMSLDGLTQNELDWLYLAASDAEDMYLTGVLGVAESFRSEDAEAWENLGYALQWYLIDANGERVALPGETGSAIDITYAMTEQRFVCMATDEQGEEPSPVYVVQAQMEDLEAYLGYLFDNAIDEDGCYIQNMVYQYLTDTWNVETDDGNLGARVVAEWRANWSDSDLYFDMMCTCVVDGLVAADHCVLAPDAEHDPSCLWYKGAAMLQLEEGTDATGKPSYTLYITVNNEDIVLAVSEMLDGQNHYFRDVRQGEAGLYVAWLYIDDEGNPWLMPLESSREIPAE